MLLRLFPVAVATTVSAARRGCLDRSFFFSSSTRLYTFTGFASSSSDPFARRRPDCFGLRPLSRPVALCANLIALFGVGLFQRPIGKNVNTRGLPQPITSAAHLQHEPGEIASRRPLMSCDQLSVVEMFE